MVIKFGLCDQFKTQLLMLAQKLAQDGKTKAVEVLLQGEEEL